MRADKPYPESRVVRWAVFWRSGDGKERGDRHFMWNYATTLTFNTRREARAYIEEQYGYIRTRPDLRQEPFRWRLPEAVRVDVILRKHKTGGS